MDRAAVVTVVIVVISERRGDRPSWDSILWGVRVAFWVRESNSVRRPKPQQVVILSEPPSQDWGDLSGIVRVADVVSLDPL